MATHHYSILTRVDPERVETIQIRYFQLGKGLGRLPANQPLSTEETCVFALAYSSVVSLSLWWNVRAILMPFCSIASLATHLSAITPQL